MAAPKSQTNSKVQERTIGKKSNPAVSAVSATKPAKGNASKSLPTPAITASANSTPGANVKSAMALPTTVKVGTTKSGAAKNDSAKNGAAKMAVTKSPAAKPANKAMATKTVNGATAPSKPAAVVTPVKTTPVKTAPGKLATAKPTKPKLARVKVGATKLVRSTSSKKVTAAVAEKKSREKVAAKRAAARSGKPIMAEISKKAPVRHPDSAKLTKNQVAENLRLGAKASKARMAVGGNANIKSHVAAANRRMQSRRDGK